MNTIRVSNSLDPDQVQTVCKSYQQTTLGHKELIEVCCKILIFYFTDVRVATSILDQHAHTIAIVSTDLDVTEVTMATEGTEADGVVQH